MESKRTAKIRASLVVGAVFTVAPGTLIVDRSTLGRMRNFPDRRWHLIDDENDEHPNAVMLVPGSIKDDVPMAANIKNLIVVPVDAMIQLIKDGTLLEEKNKKNG